MSEPKYKTVLFDSAGDLARLGFSYDMKKHAGFGDSKAYKEQIRQMNNYPGTSERLNMLIRRMKDLRDNRGVEVVFTAHEDIEKIYAKGSGIAVKGQPPADPIAIKGWPDLPGRRGPDEFCRAADNVLRMRTVNGKPVLIASKESLGPGCGNWETKDRFNGLAIQNGILPPSYLEIKAKAEAIESWMAPYIWVIYGPFGIGKTRLVATTFPKPMKVYDLDKGFASVSKKEREGIEVINKYNSEECDDWEPFMCDVESLIC